MRRKIRRREPIFVGTEGASEAQFVYFLRDLCSAENARVHVKVWQGSGGDSLYVVEQMMRYMTRNERGREYSRKFVLLDEDRMAEDFRAGRDAMAAARRAGIHVVLQRPNLEAILLRLHKGQEQRVVAREQSLAALERAWPEYEKPARKDHLNARFGLPDLQRAARFDRHLRELLKGLRLPL